jgi:hypothetical protein
MNPTIHHELMKARIADLHRQAAATAWPGPPPEPAARGRRTAASPHPLAPSPVLARVMIAALGARSPQQEPQ